MSRRKKIMVAVSTLALRSLVPSTAAAQILINCTTNLNFGQHVACGNGRYTIRPNGTANTLSGCLVNVVAPQPGRCIISAGATAPTKTVKVSFTNNTITMGGPGDTAPMKRFRMAEDGSNTEKTTLTFSPTEITNTVTINIGGRMSFTQNQVSGSYAATNRIVADVIP